MPLEEPSWWYAGEGKRAHLAERLLAPVGGIYGAAVERRFKKSTPYRSTLPVICVGNFTAGGTGKTPLTRFLIAMLAERQISAVCLSRGYGGSLAGPVWVDPVQQGAHEVGDEPLLMARGFGGAGARVMLSRDRKAGCAAIEAAGNAHAIIMDDGLQNPSLAKDLSIAVVDARRGFGNGRVIPAGPLRARLAFQLGLVDCIVVMGSDPAAGEHSIFEDLKKRFQGPVLRVAVEPTGDMDWLAGRPVLAYAGIANPGRFFGMLEGLGPRSLETRAFADHHPFTDREAAALISEAQTTDAVLVTTEKDYARLVGTAGARAELAALSSTVPITVKFEERDLVRLHALIDGVLKAPPRS